MIATELRTTDLTLVPASAHHVRAELAGPGVFDSLIGAAVPASWPPGDYDEGAQRLFLECLTAAGDAGTGWYGWYGVRTADDEAPRTVVAGGGYFGPPTPEGVVEIGYSVCPEWRRRGYATQVARALTVHAARQPGVTRVIAHAMADNPASAAVLRRSGFVLDGPGAEPGTLRFLYSPDAGE